MEGGWRTSSAKVDLYKKNETLHYLLDLLFIFLSNTEHVQQRSKTVDTKSSIDVIRRIFKYLPEIDKFFLSIGTEDIERKNTVKPVKKLYNIKSIRQRNTQHTTILFEYFEHFIVKRFSNAYIHTLLINN